MRRGERAHLYEPLVKSEVRMRSLHGQKQRFFQFCCRLSSAKRKSQMLVSKALRFKALWGRLQNELAFALTSTTGGAAKLTVLCVISVCSVYNVLFCCFDFLVGANGEESVWWHVGGYGLDSLTYLQLHQHRDSTLTIGQAKIATFLAKLKDSNNSSSNFQDHQLCCFLICSSSSSGWGHLARISRPICCSSPVQADRPGKHLSHIFSWEHRDDVRRCNVKALF